MIVYLVCFNLSLSLNEQTEQIAYWLNFLCSSLPLPPVISSNPNWSIILVGVQADRQHPSSSNLQSHLSAWQGQWLALPLHHKIFMVSSMTSEDSVRDLLLEVERVCTNIFAVHATQIPTIYSDVLESIKLAPTSILSQNVELYAEHGKDINKLVFDEMLRYFHQIGHIVCLKGNLVCTDPQLVPKIAAKFVSPEDVQASLLTRDFKNIQILSREDVGLVLNINIANVER